VVRTFADIEKLVGTATEVERVLGELGETPYESLPEEQEEETSESNIEKQVIALNNTIIHLFKGNSHDPNHHPLPLSLKHVNSVKVGTIWPLPVRG
jgi:hypothetical protein